MTKLTIYDWSELVRFKATPTAQRGHCAFCFEVTKMLDSKGMAFTFKLTFGVSFCLSLDTKEAKTKTHPAVISARKRKKSSQKKDATRKGDWNSLTGRKLSPLQMPSCLILTVVQLVNMCVIVFCSSVVPSSPFFLVVNTHPMPISQYRTSRKSQKFVTPHYWPVMHPATKTKTKTKIRIFFWPHPLHHCFAVQMIGCWLKQMQYCFFKK